MAILGSGVGESVESGNLQQIGLQERVPPGVQIDSTGVFGLSKGGVQFYGRDEPPLFQDGIRNGAMYWDTTASRMRVFRDGAWLYLREM